MRDGTWADQVVFSAFTATLVLWGGAAWAGAVSLALGGAAMTEAFDWLMAAGLCVGLGSSAVFGLLLAVGWLPLDALARFAALIAHPARARLATFIYITPMLAFAACLLASPVAQLPSATLVALGAFAAGAPSAVLAAFHAWVVMPAKTPVPRLARDLARHQRLPRNADSSAFRAAGSAR